jgi:2-oxoglutarate dehydrogenase E2 component (dihydrolipoamide succinyltransferase)
MAEYKLRLPKMGEGVIEATITAWTKNVGEQIEEDDTLFEVATDKVDSEVPCEVSGVLKKRFFEVDDVVKIGDVVAIIETEQEIEDDIFVQEEIVESTNEVIVNPEMIQVAETIVEEEVSTSRYANRFYSPLIKNIAKQEDISQAELDQIKGTGKDGRLTKDDMLAYLKKRTEKAIPETTSTTAKPSPVKETPIAKTTGIVLDNGDEIIEMDRMRKLIAEHMVASKQVSPHVQSFVEADVTKIVNWRNKIKDEFFKAEGEKITFTPIFIYYIVKAIKDYPMINVQVDGNRIIKKKNVNIGMAVALPSGNLIVPVIKNADQLSLSGLTKAVNDLAKRARENKLKPDEISGGTYTVTNMGTFGNIAASGIINQPQVALMALGTIRKMPAVIETAEGDMIGIRQKMILSHTYDHRAVDGMLGGLFAKRVAEYLENFDSSGLL